GELARVDREVLVLDGAADLLDRHGLALALPDGRGDHAFRPELCVGRDSIIGLDLAGHDSRPRPATIRKDGHGPLLTLREGRRARSRRRWRGGAGVGPEELQ